MSKYTFLIEKNENKFVYVKKSSTFVPSLTSARTTQRHNKPQPTCLMGFGKRSEYPAPMDADIVSSVAGYSLVKCDG